MTSKRVTSRIALAALLVALPFNGSLTAQETRATLRFHVYTLEHQQAEEAVSVVYPLLSSQGTVEVQPQANTLVIRDGPESLERILPALRSFDHALRRVALEVSIVEAGPKTMTDPRPGNRLIAERVGEPILDSLLPRLRKLFRYQQYAVVASAKTHVREGQKLIRRLGGGYLVSARLGTLRENDRLPLHGLRVERLELGVPRRSLIHTTLNLELGKPFILGLAKSEESPNALMVILSCRLSSPSSAPAALTEPLVQTTSRIDPQGR